MNTQSRTARDEWVNPDRVNYLKVTIDVSISSVIIPEIIPHPERVFQSNIVFHSDTRLESSV